MKKKICFVVQRYGTEINGGAEAYCRSYAEKLSDLYDISVATTCALDYITWDNYYDEGIVNINGITVHRFKVDYPRDIHPYLEKMQKTLNKKNHTLEESDELIKEQGPVSSSLIKFIKKNKNNFDLFIFFTYLYYTTVEGIKYVKNKSILISFCHDELPVYLKSFDQLFKSPIGIIYNTDEEKEFVNKRFNAQNIPSIITGIGLDIPSQKNFPNARLKFNLNKPFILYMGRIDEGKGCKELFEYFLEYKNKFNTDLQLVLTGNEIIDIPNHKDILSLGFVSEDEKYAILQECELLVMPSHFESLSIVVLEAFEFEKPVMVSGQCSVLKGHCKRSNAGLYFNNNNDFCDCLNLLINNPKLRNAMGKNGKNYVDENYQWDIIIKKFDNFINSLTN